MRPKKDPGIRREQFIEAATLLFLQHSYDDVSIKAVLDAVGERTASPSVFYYYFADKDELYRAAVENIANAYVGGLGEVFSDSSLSFDEQLAALIGTMQKAVAANRKLDLINLSCKNRSFILDMKEQVTASFTEMWEQFLVGAGLVPDGQARGPALFLSGGIAALLMDYMTQNVRSRAAELELVKEIVLFSASVLGLDNGRKQQLLQIISEG